MVILIAIFRKDVFPELTRKHLYKLLLTIILVLGCVVIVAMVIAGLSTRAKEKPGPVTETPIRIDSPTTRTEIPGMPQPRFPSPEQKSKYVSAR